MCEIKVLKAIVSAEFVCWVAENKQPLQIVNDRRFCCLMKTGRPDYHIPLAQTLSHDVRNVFVGVRKQIAHMLQVSPENNIQVSFTHLRY